jgi:hypothetical protein
MVVACAGPIGQTSLSAMGDDLEAIQRPKAACAAPFTKESDGSLTRTALRLEVDGRFVSPPRGHGTLRVRESALVVDRPHHVAVDSGLDPDASARPFASQGHDHRGLGSSALRRRRVHGGAGPRFGRGCESAGPYGMLLDDTGGRRPRGAASSFQSVPLTAIAQRTCSRRQRAASTQR